jgi:branched-chain amino acid transport system substrate-binding protein
VNKRTVKLVGVAFVAASLALAGCGSRGDSGAPATGGTAGGSAAATKVAKIGFIAPLSGGLSALGTGMRNSVDLAIR